MNMKALASSNHLICLFKNSVWNCQTDLFCRLEISDEFELRCLLHRQVGRLRSLENLVNVMGGLTVLVVVVRPIGHAARA